MKKFYILAAAAILAAACAAPKTNQEKVEEYNAAMDAIMQEYQAAVDSLHIIGSDISEEAMAVLDAAQESAIEKITALSLETIKKNPKDSVALTALQNSFYYIESDDLKEAVDGLSDELKASDLVQRITKTLDAKINTQEGKMFTDFTISNVIGLDADGNEITEQKSLSDFVGKGKYVLVDFWSPWCGPCKREIPNLKSVYEQYAGDKFDMLSVAVWEESAGMNWQNTRDTAAVYGVCWNELNNGGEEPASLYGIEGIPHIILFGPDGTIVKRDLRGEELVKAVAEAVAE